MIGKTVSHVNNDNARGIVLATGESARGKAFAIVDWFVDPKTKKVEAKRHSPEELVLLEVE
jgi:hypothetical protein